LQSYQPPEISSNIQKTLIELMDVEAKKYGQEKLPARS
jgi:hypothetical protein